MNAPYRNLEVDEVLIGLTERQVLAAHRWAQRRGWRCSRAWRPDGSYMITRLK